MDSLARRHLRTLSSMQQFSSPCPDVPDQAEALEWAVRTIEDLDDAVLLLAASVEDEDLADKIRALTRGRT